MTTIAGEFSGLSGILTIDTAVFFAFTNGTAAWRMRTFIVVIHRVNPHRTF
jgi:hypothetical protein